MEILHRHQRRGVRVGVGAGVSFPYHTDDAEELRLRWLVGFLRVQARYDTKIKTILVQSAQDVFDELEKLSASSSFSAAVRSAQIRMTIREAALVLKELFGEILPVIKDGQKESAQQAVEAFTATDIDYLRRAFAETAARAGINVDRFIEGQRRQASAHVVNAIRNVEQRDDYQLSTQVYKTKRLADTWVRRQVTSGILKGDSAHDIAKAVRSSIRPSTPGGVSYASLRLARTELNNAFHATSVALAQDRPWVEGMQWHLSKVHEPDPRGVPEICETYARQVFPVEQVPKKPHPQCRCYVTPELEEFSVFVNNLTAGQYRGWMNNVA